MLNMATSVVPIFASLSKMEGSISERGQFLLYPVRE
jgi:hypothetical protein